MIPNLPISMILKTRGVRTTTIAAHWHKTLHPYSIRFFNHPTLGEVKGWNTAIHDQVSGNVTYETNYLVNSTGQLFSAKSTIQFTPQQVLETMIADCDLVADQWLGDWTGSPFTSASHEIIPIGRLAA